MKRRSLQFESLENRTLMAADLGEIAAPQDDPNFADAIARIPVEEAPAEPTSTPESEKTQPEQPADTAGDDAPVEAVLQEVAASNQRTSPDAAEPIPGEDALPTGDDSTSSDAEDDFEAVSNGELPESDTPGPEMNTGGQATPEDLLAGNVADYSQRDIADVSQSGGDGGSANPDEDHVILANGDVVFFQGTKVEMVVLDHEGLTKDDPGALYGADAAAYVSEYIASGSETPAETPTEAPKGGVWVYMGRGYYSNTANPDEVVHQDDLPDGAVIKTDNTTVSELESSEEGPGFLAGVFRSAASGVAEAGRGGVGLVKWVAEKLGIIDAVTDTPQQDSSAEGGDANQEEKKEEEGGDDSGGSSEGDGSSGGDGEDTSGDASGDGAEGEGGDGEDAEGAGGSEGEDQQEQDGDPGPDNALTFEEYLRLREKYGWMNDLIPQDDPRWHDVDPAPHEEEQGAGADGSILDPSNPGDPDGAGTSPGGDGHTPTPAPIDYGPDHVEGPTSGKDQDLPDLDPSGGSLALPTGQSSDNNSTSSQAENMVATQWASQVDMAIATWDK